MCKTQRITSSSEQGFRPPDSCCKMGMQVLVWFLHRVTSYWLSLDQFFRIESKSKPCEKLLIGLVRGEVEMFSFQTFWLLLYRLQHRRTWFDLKSRIIPAMPHKRELLANWIQFALSTASKLCNGFPQPKIHPIIADAN